MSDTLQDELRALFAKAKMPSSPALAARIIELAEDPDSTIEQFAEVIQTDAALATRLLRMCNSVAYAQRQQVTTIHRAVSFVGVNRVRTVSLGFQLVGHLDRLGGCPFDMKRFWQHSLLRACLAHEFAESVLPVCAEEAFLIGLLQDCGILLLVQLLGKPYAELCQTEGLSPMAFFAAERRNHRYNHPQVTAAMAREWRLAEVIVTHVEKHHIEPPLTPTPTDTDLLWAAVYLAGSVRLSTPSSTGLAEPGLAKFAKLQLGMDTEALKSCLVRAGETYAELGCLLEGVVPDDLDVTDLLSQANAHLTMSVESERLRSAEEHAHLKHALGEYRERAARDPLTGILNRGGLTDAMRNCTQQARRKGEPLTVLFLDLDNFKRLNDQFGHQAGDDVLRGVAETLKDEIPGAGIVGRYGGEELLVAVSGLTEDDARRLAESVVTSVRDMEFPGLGLPGPVTCSVGAVWGELASDMTADGLIKAADELMYRAKLSGKDRCCFRPLRDVYNINLLESDGAAADACASAILESEAQGAEETLLPETFRRIATELNRETPQHFFDMRKNERKHLLAPCRLTALTAATLELESEDAYVRNISTGGVGILATRSMRRGQPAEIAILIRWRRSVLPPCRRGYP